MARVFITGSSDGLGKMAGELLIGQGHQVVLHARSAARADETRLAVAGAEDVVIGDANGGWNLRQAITAARLMDGLPGLLHGRRVEERAFAEGRGPDPRTKDNVGGVQSVQDDPLQ